MVRLFGEKKYEVKNYIMTQEYCISKVNTLTMKQFLHASYVLYIKSSLWIEFYTIESKQNWCYIYHTESLTQKTYLSSLSGN